MTTMENDSGSVYVYTRSGTTWTQEAKLVAADGRRRLLWYSSVSISEDTIVVGARGTMIMEVARVQLTFLYEVEHIGRSKQNY